MPTYSYSCEKCNKNFELFFTIKEYNDSPKCIFCKSKKTYRDYYNDISSINCSVKKSDNELKTIGDLANRNRDRLSNDEKTALEKKHNEYKDERFKNNKNLPKGMTKLPKQTKMKWT